MKKLIPLVLLLFSGNSVAQVAGVVIADHYTCNTSDRIVIETRMGLTNAEVYRGYSDTHEGDVLTGDLHSYGFTEIYKDGDEVGRIYVDDYMVSESTASDWCFNR